MLTGHLEPALTGEHLFFSISSLIPLEYRNLYKRACKSNVKELQFRYINSCVTSLRLNMEMFLLNILSIVETVSKQLVMKAFDSTCHFLAIT